MSAWVSSNILPGTEWYNYGSKPEGGDEAIASFFDQAFPQIAGIIESAALPLGVEPEQISLHFHYDPSKPNDYEVEYAAQVAVKHGGSPHGLGQLDIDIEAMAIEGVKNAAIRAAATTIATQLGVQVGAKAVPVIGSAAVAIVGIVQDYKSVLGTEAGRLNAGMALAAAIPIVGPIAAMTFGIKQLVDFIKSKARMEAEQKRAEGLMKMVNSVTKPVIEEAKYLAVVMGSRGIGLVKPPSAAFRSRLLQHYKKLAIANRMNAAVPKEMVSDIAKRQVEYDALDAKIWKMANAGLPREANVILGTFYSPFSGVSRTTIAKKVYAALNYTFQIRPEDRAKLAAAMAMAGFGFSGLGLLIGKSRGNPTEELTLKRAAITGELGSARVAILTKTIAAEKMLVAAYAQLAKWFTARSGEQYILVAQGRAAAVRFLKGEEIYRISTPRGGGPPRYVRHEMLDSAGGWNNYLSRYWKRRDRLRALLQAARDMRKLNVVLTNLPELPVFEPEKEILLLAEAILKAAPTLPRGIAVNIAAKAVEAAGVPLTDELRRKIAADIAAALAKQVAAQPPAAKAATGRVVVPSVPAEAPPTKKKVGGTVALLAAAAALIYVVTRD